MKAWLTVLALLAAVPRPAPATPVLQPQAVAPATAFLLSDLPDLHDIVAALVGPAGAAAGPDPVALSLQAPAALAPWSWEPPAPGPGAAALPTGRDALKALALGPAMAMPRDAQSLMALARTLPGAAQAARELRELRELPREERMDYLMALLQDPALESGLHDAAAGPGFAAWAEYGLGVAMALLCALVCIVPGRRCRGAGRAFNSPQAPLPPAFPPAAARQPPAQAAGDAAGERVRRKVHLAPLNRPLPTTQATAHARPAD